MVPKIVFTLLMSIRGVFFVLDFPLDFFLLDEDLEELQHEIARKKGYELVDHSMILHVRKIES